MDLGQSLAENQLAIMAMASRLNREEASLGFSPTGMSSVFGTVRVEEEVLTSRKYPVGWKPPPPPPRRRAHGHPHRAESIGSVGGGPTLPSFGELLEQD